MIEEPAHDTVFVLTKRQLAFVRMTMPEHRMYFIHMRCD
jgi:hypothetical protein